MSEKKLIFTDDLYQKVSSMGLQNGTVLGHHSGTADVIAEIIQNAPAVDPASCLNWHTGMPPEHDSQCAKLKGTDKWHPWMFEKVSDKVLVTIEDAEGNRCTDVSQTFDGKWKGYIHMEDLKLKIVAWTEMPGPAKEIEDGVH